jgi:hypothetical protein
MTHPLSNHKANQDRQQERSAHWGSTPTVRCLGGFSDGNLKPFFDEIGQDFHILHNEIRTIPASLLERCLASGARFERVL